MLAKVTGLMSLILALGAVVTSFEANAAANDREKAKEECLKEKPDIKGEELKACIKSKGGKK